MEQNTGSEGLMDEKKALFDCYLKITTYDSNSALRSAPLKAE